jgi:DNA-binding transcriptional ArsR family regulator
MLTPIREFLSEYVESFEELDALSALVERGSVCEADALAAAVRESPESLEETLGRLERRGLVERGAAGGVRLLLGDPRLPELVALYRSDPVAVLKMMNTLAIERLRAGATRAFADAFLLRRKKPDG